MTTTMKLKVTAIQTRTFERVVEIDHLHAVDLVHREADHQLGTLFEGVMPIESHWHGGQVVEVSDSAQATSEALTSHSPLKAAIDAISVALGEGGSDELALAKQQLEKLVGQLCQHDQKLNGAMEPPVGDDYNDFRDILGMA